MFIVIKKFTLIITVCILLISMTGIFIVGMAINNNEKNKTHKILLDAGHGEPDGGCVAPDGTKEAELNLDLTKKLEASLKNLGYDISMTRHDESGIHDKNLDTVREMKRSDMHKRLKLKTSSGADIFVSIHMNKFEIPKYRGPQVLYDGSNENAKLLAEQIQAQLNLLDSANTRQVAVANKDVFLLQSSDVPSVIVECGFLSNPDELELLKTDEYRQKVADAIAVGIKNYFQQ